MKIFWILKILTYSFIISIAWVLFAGYEDVYANSTIYTLDYPQTDANNDDYYDKGVFLGTLQGIINKNDPLFYLIRRTYHTDIFNWTNKRGGWYNVDQYWLDKFTQDGWLKGKQIQSLSSIDNVITQFKNPHISCLIVWDPNVDATVNAATSVAGVENCPIVMKGSALYTLLTQTYQIPIKIDLTGKFTGNGTIWGTTRQSTGSKKNDTYIWVIENYLKTDKLDPHYLYYFEDAYARRQNTEWPSYDSIRDWSVYRKAFVFDLQFGPSIIPSDDWKDVYNHQPMGTDWNTLKEIFSIAYSKINGQAEMIEVGGFPPWWDKYTPTCTLAKITTNACKSRTTGYNNDGTEATSAGYGEGAFINFIASYNGHNNSSLDYASSNTSFHLNYQKQNTCTSNCFVQPARPTKQALIDKGYLNADGTVVNKIFILHKMGDFDGNDMLGYVGPHHLERRNPEDTTPIAWMLNPIIYESIPDIADYAMSLADDKNYFMADGGPGYSLVNNFDPNKTINDIYIEDTLPVDGPGRYPSSISQSGLPAWKINAATYFSRYDMSIIGGMLTGTAKLTPNTRAAIANVVGDGVIGLASPNWTNITNMQGELEGAAASPLYIPLVNNAMHGLHYNYWNDPNAFNWSVDAFWPEVLEGEGALNSDYTPKRDKPYFIAFHHQFTDPDFIGAVDTAFKNKYPDIPFTAVDPYTFMYLLRVYLGGDNNYHYSIYNNPFPKTATKGKDLNLTFKLRNNGWDTWNPGQAYNLAIYLNDDINNRIANVPLPNIVHPGNSVSVSITVPGTKLATTGKLKLSADLVREGVTWFQWRGNIPASKTVNITESPADLNNDTYINKLDISYLLTHWQEKPEYNLAMITAILKDWRL